MHVDLDGDNVKSALGTLFILSAHSLCVTYDEQCPSRLPRPAAEIAEIVKLPVAPQFGDFGVGVGKIEKWLTGSGDGGQLSVAP
jgi:hypothetical protein